MKKWMLTILVLILCLCLCSCKSDDYSNAVSLMEEGKYQEALTLFQNLGDYEDSAEKSLLCVCSIAEEYAESGKLKEAAALLMEYSEHPQAEELFYTILINEISENYLPNVEQAEESWGEYLLVWMKALQAVADKTRTGDTIDIPEVDQSAPQVIALKRSMEKAGKSIARIREAYSEEILQQCETDIQDLVHTLLESAQIIEKQFQDLDSWAVTTLFYGLQEKNASKANNSILNALYAIEDAVETVLDNRN